MFFLSELDDSESDNLPPMIAAMLAAEDAEDEDEEDRRLDALRATWEPPFGEDYAEARCELACLGCHTSVQTAGGTSWLRAANKSVSEDEASLILDRLFGAAPYNFYRSDAILDPYEGLRPFRVFLEYHKGHELQARTVPA